ncbi:MAG TPA: sigma factor [Polyangiales bacterium]|nr:sigma factor [Polyangiales bacterium]
MVRLAAGDRSAFEPAYELLWPVLRHFAQRMLADDAAADDAAQSALLKVFTRCSELDVERDALTWTLGITAYECRTLRRQQARRREVGEDALRSHVADERGPEGSLLARELERAAAEVLGALHPLDVETLRAMMDGVRPVLPAATFRKRLERAIGRLRAAWRSRHEHD